jgi:glycosyltransferase involved in cell wall biosynthesis
MIETFALGANVQLVDYYLPFTELIAYLRATDIYLTPYLDPTQIVSGTLAYAVGCGKAIISTPYLYARELLADERGLLVKFRDPPSLAENILSLLDDPMRRRAIERRAYRFGRQMTWPQVASQYRDLFASLFPSLDGGESMDRVLFPA